MIDPFANSLLQALRDDLHDARKIGRDQVVLLSDIRDALIDIREELRTTREERTARHSNGHAAIAADG